MWHILSGTDSLECHYYFELVVNSDGIIQREIFYKIHQTFEFTNSKNIEF